MGIAGIGGFCAYPSPAGGARGGRFLFLFWPRSSRWCCICRAPDALPRSPAAPPPRLARTSVSSFLLAYFAQIALRDLTFSQNIGWVGVGVMAAIVALGLVMRLGQRSDRFDRLDRCVALPTPIIALDHFWRGLRGRNWALNARMVICAAPAIAMLSGWALDGILGRARFTPNEESCGVNCNLRPALAGLMAILLGAVYITQTFGAAPQKNWRRSTPTTPTPTPSI